MGHYGTEVAYRLGPGTEDRARAIAARLAAAAEGCSRHTFFLTPDGVYGALAEWDDLDEAEGFAGRPETVRVLDDLERDLGRRPGVRVYVMEVTIPHGSV